MPNIKQIYRKNQGESFFHDYVYVCLCTHSNILQNVTYHAIFIRFRVAKGLLTFETNTLCGTAVWKLLLEAAVTMKVFCFSIALAPWPYGPIFWCLFMVKMFRKVKLWYPRLIT